MTSKGSEGQRRRPVLADVDAIRLCEILVNVLDAHVDDIEDAGLPASELTGAEVETFCDAGVLTDDAGFVVTLADGREFQVTVVQSRK